MTMTDRAAAELEHAIIEAAKASHREDQDMSFVQHLEMQARDIAGREWTWETLHTASGGWSIELTPIRSDAPEPDQPRGML
jgi:hypothetical protein